jgi:hypothetical protein
MSFGDDVADRHEPAAEPPIEGWPTFAAELHARLVEGRRTYGEGSLQRPPTELVGELEQEAIDVAGWGYVLWMRLRALHARAELVGNAPGMEPRAALARLPAPDASQVHPTTENASMDRVRAPGPSADSSIPGKEPPQAFRVVFTADELRMLAELCREFRMTPSEALAFAVLTLWRQTFRRASGATP